MQRSAKAVWNEAHETALKRGFSDTEAVKHASQVALSYADRLTNAAVERYDDEKADRKLFGGA